MSLLALGVLLSDSPDHREIFLGASHFELAKDGVPDPDRLCEQALNELPTPPPRVYYSNDSGR